jgi:hypothetical protein
MIDHANHATHSTDEPKQNVKLARILFVALALAVLSLMPWAGWHSAPSVDARTQIEMIRGVADHGLPYTTNAFPSQFHELQARWNINQNNRLWGLYPPLLAYLAYPAFELGGLPAVSRMNLLVLIFFAGGMFLLSKSFLRDSLLAIAATYIAVLATPVASSSFDISSFILCEALIVWSLYVALKSFESARFRLHFAFAAGVVGGLSVAAHLLMFPMVVGIIGAMAQPDDDPTRSRFRLPLLLPLEHWVPTARSVLRAAVMTLGLAITLLPIAILNHERFRSYNPISYGPCVWHSCAETGVDKQTIGVMLRFSVPTFVWMGVTILSAWLARKRPLALVAVASLAALTLMVAPQLRHNTWEITKIGWAYVVDPSLLQIKQYVRPPDRIGLELGPWLIRSMLQTTPFLALAVMVPTKTQRDRKLAVLLALPSFMLLLVCALRANEPPAYALGFSMIYLRYTVPAVGPLAVLAIASTRSLPWKRKHVAIIAAGSIVLIGLFDGGGDEALWRRLVLLYGTLLAGVGAVVAVWLTKTSNSERRREIALYFAASSIVLGIGGAVGVTVPAVWNMRNANDRRVDAIASHTPDRFALVGFSPQIDTPLALRASRDIEYFDLYEVDAKDGWTNLRFMVDGWSDTGRPIFGVWPVGIDIQSPWPDVVFEQIDESERLYRVRKLYPPARSD